MGHNMHAVILGSVIDFTPISVKRAPGAHRIATHLRKENNMDVEVIDFAVNWPVEKLKDYLTAILKSDTVFLGVSATFDMHFDNMTTILNWVKEKYPKIAIVGGTQSYYNCTSLPIDWLIHGYGELGISALVRHLTSISTDLKYSRHGTYNYIDATHDYDATRLKDFTIDYEERDFIQPQECLTVELGRGCIFNCGFCTLLHRNIKGDHSRSEDNLYDELLRNYEKWGTTTYTFSDETVNDYHEKLERYARVVTKLPFRPHFGGYARGDLLVARPDDWQMISDLGFDSHFYGVESFNQQAARVIGKGMDGERLKEGLLKVEEFFNKQGFYRGHINLIAGLPGDTEDKMRQTLEWLSNNWWIKGNSATINPLWISPNNRPYDEDSEFSKDPEKWGYFLTTMKESDPEGIGIKAHKWNTMYKNIYEHICQTENEGYERKYGGIRGMTFMNWKNGDMNLYRILKFLTEEWFSPNMKHSGPAVHSFHNWLVNPKYTWEDMKKPQLELGHTTEFNSKFIEEYIEKKFKIL